MAKETFYFKHDYNSRNDRKLINVTIKHGMEGIGVYWCIIEMLYEEGGYLPIEYDRITFELRSKKNLIQSIINDFNLFKIDNTNFWSESVLERLKERCQKSAKARESINKRWGKYKRNSNVLHSNEKRNTRRGEERRRKEKKGEEKKGEKIVREEKKIFIAPTLEEVKIYFVENGYKQEEAMRAYNYYSTANWTDSKGNKVRNWKQKMIAVWFKPENKIQVNADDEEYKKLRKTIYGE